MLKNKKGITLIALIITIVVLLILAVVAIQEIIGDGIITYAINSIDRHNMAQIKEEVELIKTDAQTESFITATPLTQTELLRRINENFEGSTIEGNTVILKDGEYKIVVGESLNISVEKIEEADEDGDGEDILDAEDIELSYTVSKTNNGHNINLRIDLVGMPEYDSTTLRNEYLENEYLPGMTADEVLTLGANLMGATPQYVYDNIVKSSFDDMPYSEFQVNGDAKAQEKGYSSAAALVKAVLILNLMEGSWETLNVYEDGAKVVYSQKLLPDLVDKTEEIESTIEGWYNNEKRFDIILREITGYTTIEDYRAQLNRNIDMGVESIKFFTREHALIYIAGQAYTRTHPVVVTKPDGSTQNIDWFANRNNYLNYATTESGEHIFEVTAPSGQKEKIVALVDGIKLDKTKIEEAIIEGEQTTATLTAILYNLEGEITWTTSNDSVAVVEGTGTTVNVVIKSVGEATITATCGGYSATCTVKVGNYNEEVIIPTITATGNFANNPNISEVREGNVPIPTGYTYVKGNVDGGLVIKDSSGNEWVWVPAKVSDISEVINGKNVGKLYDFTNTGATAKNYPTTSNSGYREPDVVTNASSGADSTTGNEYDVANLSIVLEGEYAKTQTAASFKAQLQAEFDNMIESVSLYGGYYIGRYEAGGSINSPVLQQGATVIRNTNSSSNWYYMYTSAKKLAANNSVTTGMIWGCQWDNTLRWLVNSNNLSWTDLTDSREWGNYNNSEGNASENSRTGREAGYSEYWKAGNIYDLAGNYWDWTLEANDTDLRVGRGGSDGNNGNNNPASHRNFYIPTNTNGNRTFRPTLIIE